MKFASLGSGSKGNATVVSSANTAVMVDCGFTIKETEQRLARLNLQPQQLNAILVTHEHGDHIKGVGPFARRHNIPVYTTAGTFFSGRLGNVSDHHFISAQQVLTIGDLQICPVSVPHDAKEPVQYVVSAGKKSLGILTDLGSASRHVVREYSNLDALVVECNHCLDLLAVGPYPQSLKQRVASNLGHLNNQQTADLLDELSENAQAPWQHLVIAHLSEQNNALSKVKEVLATHLQKAQNAHFACQKNGFSWLEIV